MILSTAPIRHYRMAGKVSIFKIAEKMKMSRVSILFKLSFSNLQTTKSQSLDEIHCSSQSSSSSPLLLSRSAWPADGDGGLCGARERERVLVGWLVLTHVWHPSPSPRGWKKSLNNDRPFVWLRGPDGAASLTSWPTSDNPCLLGFFFLSAHFDPTFTRWMLRSWVGCGYQVPIMIARWVRLIGSLLGGNDLYGFVRKRGQTH